MSDPESGSRATIAALLRAARAQLAERSDSAALDAEVLLAAALGKPRSFLYAWPDHEPTTSVRARFEDALTARSSGTPVAYTLGVKEFFGIDLAVDPSVLIPRPDTETLVECAIERIPPDAVVVDLGTGSGAVAVVLARERPDCRMMATDRSFQALRVAQGNGRHHACRVNWLCADWTAALAAQSVDALVSNPPYVAEGDPHLAALAAEPASALVSGPDGLDAIRAIIGDAGRVLRPGGLLLLEHGWDQAEAVRALLSDAGFEAVESVMDLNGHERVSVGQRAVGALR
ncbi:peptide chain release factor N(5)-glutamine methyltransferase [Algiphilus sp.]|uniref:peptide chain release factor N(5)-glutamine methyltransferase n=1 Tax=Algiphilus sp. TaxID=1872431 RepID=UPI003B51DAEF